eukprot:2133197-Prymnesium_polylepis.1
MTTPASATKAWPALFHATMPPGAKASHSTRTQRTDTFLMSSHRSLVPTLYSLVTPSRTLAPACGGRSVTDVRGLTAGTFTFITRQPLRVVRTDFSMCQWHHGASRHVKLTELARS